MIRAMNMEAQHRKKDPVRLHKQLLESAATIAGRDGIASLFFALFARLLAIMEEAIAELMAADNVSYGRFTRAYLRYLSAPELTDTQESRQLMVLSLAMPDEPVLRKCWRDWMLDHLAKGDELDNSHTGTLVRYAADGIWLSELTEGRTMSPGHRQSLVSDLTKMTLPA